MKNILLLFVLTGASFQLMAQEPNFTDEYRGEVLREAQIMPRFPGCEGQGLGAEELQLCAIKKLLQFIKDEQVYPDTARQKGKQGVVVVEVTVDTLGNLTHPQIVISRGEGLDQEALRILKKMPRWIPAEHHGRHVEVFFRIPVEFRL